MATFHKSPHFAWLPRGLVVEKVQRTWTKLLGWQIETTYKGRPVDVDFHRVNRATSFPDAKSISVDESPEYGGFWAITVLDAIQLNSTWALDSSQNDVPLVGSWMGIALDKAFPGWPRFIEIKVNEHYAAETAKNRFDFTTINSSALFEEDGVTAADFNISDYNVASLNTIATNYALAYITGQETFFEPRWVIRNQVTVSPEYVFDPLSVLYTNVNWMLSPFWMAGEAIQGGEIVPQGIIVPSVKWWYKQPFQIQQTTDNQTVINREWWGLDFFNENLYQSKV